MVFGNVSRTPWNGLTHPLGVHAPQLGNPCSTAKVRQIFQEYPDEFSATPARDLRCNFLRRVSQMRPKVFVESHRKSKQHQRKLETKCKSQSKQTFLQLDQVNFKEHVVSSFVAADTPLDKLNHLSLKFLIATMGKVLPSETAARACDAKLASPKEKQIQELLQDKNFFYLWMNQRLLNKSVLVCLWAA